MVTPPGEKMGRFPPISWRRPGSAGWTGCFGWGAPKRWPPWPTERRASPRWIKLVGPGNQFVAEAKKQVFGQVGIDMVAGPSEILVIADGKCRPEIVAADLLSQAEHDPNASAVLVTDSAALAEAVQAAVEEQLPKLLRKDIARASIDRNGKIIVPSLWTPLWRSPMEIAPEHLELCVEQPFDYLDKIQNAGSVFLGRQLPGGRGITSPGPTTPCPPAATRPVLQPAVCGRFCKEDAVYLLYQEGPGEGPDVRVQLCQEGGPHRPRPQRGHPV